MKIGIIGGSDGLGKTLNYYFKDEFDVYITGRDHNKGQKVANDIGVNYIESNKELAKISDILIISVPIHHTSNVIREVAPFMKKNSLLMDVTSVKEEPSKVMAEVLRDDVDYIPSHPIFGPRTSDLANQVIVLTPHKKGKWYDKVYNYLNNKNMRIIETTAQKHDYMMSIVQVLTHFSFISTASTIEKLKVDLSETEDYESPIYNLMIDMIARIVAQNPYLTYYIQSMNKNGHHIRNTFSEAVTELRDVINNGDDEKFIEIAINATKHMDDITNALGRSDKAINSLNQEYSLLTKSIGHEIALRHIYSGKVHVGILESVDNKTTTLKKGNEIKRLRLANIEVLSAEELKLWKIENYNRKTESISCVFKNNINEKIILKTIANIEDIIDVKLSEKYSGPQIAEDSISLTFKIESISKYAILNVKELLRGFGGIIR